DLVRGIPNENLLKLLTKYTGEGSRDKAEEFLLERLEFTVTEGRSSGSGEERTRTKDVKVANYEGKAEVSSARREFEEAYFEFRGARDYYDYYGKSFKNILNSAEKAMGDTSGVLSTWTSRDGDRITLTGSYNGTKLDSTEQFEAKYKG